MHVCSTLSLVQERLARPAFRSVCTPIGQAVEACRQLRRMRQRPNESCLSFTLRFWQLARPITLVNYPTKWFWYERGLCRAARSMFHQMTLAFEGRPSFNELQRIMLRIDNHLIRQSSFTAILI